MDFGLGLDNLRKSYFVGASASYGRSALDVAFLLPDQAFDKSLIEKELTRFMEARSQFLLLRCGNYLPWGQTAEREPRLRTEGREGN